MNFEYMTVMQYVEVKSKLIGKVATYDILIETLEKAILEAALAGHMTQGELEDGQMKVRFAYRSIGQMTDGITALRKIRQDYINQYNGRVTRLVGGSL